MEYNSNEMKIIDKANFYKANELKAHVLTIPKSSFKNVIFQSNIEEGNYFWAMLLDKKGETIGIPFRLFLSEIYDIIDYKTLEEENAGHS